MATNIDHPGATIAPLLARRAGPAIAGMAAVLLLAALSGPAHAVERQFDLTGAEIVFGSPCAREVVVTPSVALPAGHVRIVATSDRQDDLDRLTGQSGAQATFGAKAECPDTPPPRTLHVEVQIPGAMPIAVRDSGSETYRLGAFAAPLDVETGGSTDVTAEAVGMLHAKLRGSGDVHVGTVSGAVDVDLSGSGTVGIQSVNAPSLVASLSGSGDLTVGRAEMAHATIAGTGSGDVRIRNAALGTLAARFGGSGDLTIMDGRIPDLTLESTGSSDISIAASIGTLRLSAEGSGSVTLPHVATRQSVQTGHDVTVTIGP